MFDRLLATGIPTAPGFLQLVLDTSLTGTMLLRPVLAAGEAGALIDFTWDYLNPAAQRMLALPAQPAASFLTLFPTAATVGVVDFYREAFGSGQVRYRQNAYLHDGLDGYYSLVAQRYEDVLLVQFTDANDQPRSAMEEALRQSQAREQAARAEAERQRHELQRAFEQAPVAIAVYRGPRYLIELANPTVCRLWGRTPAQLLGKGLFEALPEVAGMGYEALLNQVLTTGETHVAHAMPAVHEREGRRDTVYWDFVYVPLYQDDALLTGVMVVANEVTAQVVARQQAERLAQDLDARVQERTQLLRQAHSSAELQRGRLEQLVREAPAPICILVGPELVYELVNPPYQDLFGGRPLPGLTLAQALPEVAASHVGQALQQVYETGRTYRSEEAEVPILDPASGELTLRYFNYVVQARYQQEGQIDGLIIYGFEVTEQVIARRWVESRAQQARELAQRLEQTNQQLSRTNADLDMFVYTASHDLKAPIANIEGITAALRHTLPAAVLAVPPTSQLLDLLDGAIKRFRLTIDQLTDVSRLQQAQNLPVEQVPLAPVLADVLLDVQAQLVQAGAELTVEVEPDVQVQIAPKNLRSIIYNLLSNAIKYRDPARPARLQVQVATTGPWGTLTVQDNGLGLSKPQQSRLFQLFQRLHTHVEGTGVGLYMVKRMVENVGGVIEVQSQQGVGTTFTVRLPT